MIGGRSLRLTKHCALRSYHSARTRGCVHTLLSLGMPAWQRTTPACPQTRASALICPPRILGSRQFGSRMQMPHVFEAQSAAGAQKVQDFNAQGLANRTSTRKPEFFELATQHVSVEGLAPMDLGAGRRVVLLVAGSRCTGTLLNDNSLAGVLAEELTEALIEAFTGALTVALEEAPTEALAEALTEALIEAFTETLIDTFTAGPFPRSSTRCARQRLRRGRMPMRRASPTRRRPRLRPVLSTTAPTTTPIPASSNFFAGAATVTR